MALRVACAALCGAAIAATGPAWSQDEAAAPNVIVDSSVLDTLTSGAVDMAGALPAPTQKPVSRLLIGPGATSAAMASPDATYESVPTTPIESTPASELLPSGAEPPTTPNMPGTGDVTATETEDSMNDQLMDEPMDAAIDAMSSDPIPTESATVDDSGLTAGGVAAGSALPAAPPPSPAAEAAAESVTETQSDAAESAAAASSAGFVDGQVRIVFEPQAHRLPEPAKAELAGLVETLMAEPFRRVQVLAYAAGDDDTASVARRVSLGRALAVRSYLSDQGIAIGRMDVRALGNAAHEQPVDRVDVIPEPL